MIIIIPIQCSHDDDDDENLCTMQSWWWWSSSSAYDAVIMMMIIIDRVRCGQHDNDHHLCIMQYWWLWWSSIYNADFWISEFMDFFFGFLSLSREPKEIVQEICWCQNYRIYESFSNDFCISVFLYLWSSGFFIKILIISWGWRELMELRWWQNNRMFKGLLLCLFV